MEIISTIIVVILALWVLSKLGGAKSADSAQSGRQSRTVRLGDILPPEFRNLEAEDHYYLRVAGVSHYNDDGSSRQEVLKRCELGEILELRRQPEHRHDKNAIQVRRPNGDMLGFIPKNEARLMAPEMDAGRQYLAILATLDGGEGRKRWRGAGIVVVKVKNT